MRGQDRARRKRKHPTYQRIRIGREHNATEVTPHARGDTPASRAPAGEHHLQKQPGQMPSLTAYLLVLGNPCGVVDGPDNVVGVPGGHAILDGSVVNSLRDHRRYRS